MHQVCEPFIRRRAVPPISKKARVVIFARRKPATLYFSTDTGRPPLRAMEIKART